MKADWPDLTHIVPRSIMYKKRTFVLVEFLINVKNSSLEIGCEYQEKRQRNILLYILSRSIRDSNISQAHDKNSIQNHESRVTIYF